jgi:uncharacterized alkaline shock family protein YloU
MTEYLIATSVLESIVRGSLAGDERLRVHSSLPLVGSRAADVTVDGEECHVVIQVDARMGEVLPELTNEIRSKIVSALGRMTGLRVSEVDVVFGGVFPVGA